jgi:hypothetical protein
MREADRLDQEARKIAASAIRDGVDPVEIAKEWLGEKAWNSLPREAQDAYIEALKNPPT